MHANCSYASGQDWSQMNRRRGEIMSKWSNQEGLPESEDKSAGPQE